jgi:hypothetical protein
LTQSQKDLILFLSKLIDVRDGKISLDSFIVEIGQYRFETILPGIEKLGILKHIPVLGSPNHCIQMNNFSIYTDKDIDGIIKSIQNREFDF